MGVLKLFGAIAALCASLFVAYIAYYLYANQRAQSAATNFCNAVIIGSAESGIGTQAAAVGARYLSISLSNLHQVFFQGAPYNGFYCDLSVADGKVVSRQLRETVD